MKILILVITSVTFLIALKSSTFNDAPIVIEIFLSVAALLVTLPALSLTLPPFKLTDMQNNDKFSNFTNFSSAVESVKSKRLFVGVLFFLVWISCDTAYAQTYCDGSTVSLEPIGIKKGHTLLRWEYSPNDSVYTTIVGANQDVYSFTAQYNPSNSGYYRAVYDTNGAIRFLYYFRVIVVETPTPPTVNSNGPVCGSGATMLTASGSSGSYRWYDAESGGNLISSSSTYTTPTLNTSRTYYVSAINTTTGCESNRVAVTAIVNPIPAAPTTTDGERDDPGSVTLSAAGAPSGGSYQWFNVDGTLISGETNATYTTPHLSSTTDYYVSVVGPGSCASSRTLVTARILLTSPMPISLAYFKGEVVERQVHLLWTTASEENNDRFEIERSKDGENFKMIGTVKGNGNSYQLLHYNFTDTHPGSGTIYYRLKQVDLSGSYSYSKVISLSLGHLPATGLAQTYPNPFTTELHALITIPTTGEVTISVVDVGGKVVHYDKQSMLAGLNKVTLPLADLSSGLYLLKIVCPTASITAKVIKSP